MPSGSPAEHAIVTGAGRGIGRAIARAMSAAGADVLLLGRGEDPLRETAQLIGGDAGGDAWALQCDIRDDERVDAVVDAAVQRWGSIDVLANNAGIDDDTPFVDVDRARWPATSSPPIDGAFVISQAVARAMRETGGGAIVHNASIDASGGDGSFPLATHPRPVCLV